MNGMSDEHTSEGEGGHLLDVQQVADAWGVSPATARRWARHGRLPAVRTPGGGGYRFTSAALPRWGGPLL